jgi:MoaA/NifB/PqqE/SkfB family radical SAM enzyme
MKAPEMSSKQARERVEKKDWKPRNAVWELTLACNLQCQHCGSSAGKARANELSLDECLTVADHLGEMGAELVTLSGGEPTLKRGWDKIARRLNDHGILTNMVTNGYYRGRTDVATIAQQALDAGMCNVGISIDGSEDVHETIRGKGTYAATIESIGTFAKAGMRVGVLTTVNRLNFPNLERIRKTAMDAGATLWRLQIAKPMGEMKTHDDWVITPAQYLELVPRLARLKRTPGIHLAVGDSIGYYGPHDKVLRGRGWRGRAECWQGCQAGMHAIGIEADGGIKGCLSLQAKWGGCDPFVEGNLRETPLTELWYKPGVFGFNRDFDQESLSGFCGTCKQATMCRGGARCVSSSFMGHLNEDPYCYYRLESMLNGNQDGKWGKTAAAAAAALVLSMGVSGCPTSEPDYGVPPDEDIKAEDALDEDNCCAPEYGVFPDMLTEPDVQLDYGIPPQDVVATPDVQLEYGMPPEDVVAQPDIQLDYGIPPEDVVVAPDVQPEYGIPPEDVVAQPDIQMDYGLPPLDIVEHDAINCEEICCECEYGVIPEEVYKECCAPDPCADACCDCDYGEPPPDECCD